MTNLQIRNIPEELLRRLHNYARENDYTISEVVITAVQRELERCEWKKRLAQQPKTDLGISAAELLAEERLSATRELGEPLRN